MIPKRFVAKPLHLLPVAASLLTGILCAFLVLESRMERPYVTILPETGFGPLLNAVFFVALAGAGATVIYLLLKWGADRVIHLLILSSITIITFTLSLLYLSTLFVVLNVEVERWLLLVFSAVLTMLVDAGVFLGSGTLQSLVVLVLGGAIGAFLGTSIPMLSATLVLVLLAVYDVVAVYRGPIGRIGSEGLGRLRGVSFSFMNVHIGLGDLTFYSMLVSQALLNSGWRACAAATIGVLLGSYFALKMLERRGMFPGLPLSIALGLAAAYVSVLLP